MNKVLHLDNISVKRNNTVVFQNFTWEIRKHENWAIIGKAGSGKSSLFSTLDGKYIITDGRILNYFDGFPESGTYLLRKHIAFVYFQNQEINYNRYYYQQRYYSTEVEGTLLTSGFLGWSTLEGINSKTKLLLEILSIPRFLGKEFIKLSNGENRKVLIAKALLKEPKILVLDNPYLGLDEPSRKNLCSIIDKIAEQGVQIILTSQEDDLPHCINRFLFLDDFKIVSVASKKTISQNHYKPPLGVLNFPEPISKHIHTAVKFSNLLVKYDESTIINHIDWEIKHGEKWALTGQNGSGKSMLLSLAYADHPQAYANEIIILDKVRGKGESIWEIKEKIGYVSPEMHFYFDQQQTTTDMVFGGLFENPYSPSAINKDHEDLYNNLLLFYNIEHLKNKKFSRLSTSEQTLFLLFRAILKNPLMLLLDEPFHGFDLEMIEKTKLLLDTFCVARTLIFVSHNLKELPVIIDNFANLENGKLVIKNDTNGQLQ